MLFVIFSDMEEVIVFTFIVAEHIFRCIDIYYFLQTMKKYLDLDIST